jgi:hypothetical protein
MEKVWERRKNLFIVLMLINLIMMHLAKWKMITKMLLIKLIRKLNNEICKEKFNYYDYSTN